MNYILDEKIIKEFHGALNEILKQKLVAVNTIIETFKCNFPYLSTTAIIQEKPFIMPIKLNIEGVVFHNTNDPHC